MLKIENYEKDFEELGITDRKEQQEMLNTMYKYLLLVMKNYN